MEKNRAKLQEQMGQCLRCYVPHRVACRVPSADTPPVADNHSIPVYQSDGRQPTA
nr:hypothetical protein [Prevotella sp. C561]